MNIRKFYAATIHASDNAAMNLLMQQLVGSTAVTAFAGSIVSVIMHFI